MQNGLNTYTGGTITSPSVNISAATLDNLSVSGATSLGVLSATTIISGSTNLYNIFSTSATTPSFVGDIQRTGFVDAGDPDVNSSISFDSGTNIFTISGSSWSYYWNGQKITISGSKTLTLPTSTQTNYIYIDNATGALASSTVVYTLEDGHLPVATVYYNSGNTPSYFLADERHTDLVDQRWHWNHHFTEGTEVVHGGSGTITGYTINSDVNANKTFSITESKNS